MAKRTKRGEVRRARTAAVRAGPPERRSSRAAAAPLHDTELKAVSGGGLVSAVKQAWKQSMTCAHALRDGLTGDPKHDLIEP